MTQNQTRNIKAENIQQVKSYSRGEKGSGITIANISDGSKVELIRNPNSQNDFWDCYSFYYNGSKKYASSLKDAKERLENQIKYKNC